MSMSKTDALEHWDHVHYVLPKGEITVKIEG